MTIVCEQRYCLEPLVGEYIYGFPLKDPTRYLCEHHLFEAIRIQRDKQRIRNDQHLFVNHPRPSELI
jgi:hypothetical protein